jgi:hypothetical protein
MRCLPLGFKTVALKSWGLNYPNELPQAVTRRRFYVLRRNDVRLGIATISIGERFAAGVVVYDGENVVGFGDNLYAVPIRALWVYQTIINRFQLS